MAETHLVPVVDVHTHLTDPKFDKDIDEVISQAKEDGVAAALVVSESAADFAKVLALAERHPSFVVPCLGLHPVQPCIEAADEDITQRSVTMQDFEEAEKILEEHCSKLAAIGEVGLDFTPRWCRSPEDKAIQREVLSKQVKLAQKFDLPLNVHSRSAGHHAITLLKEHGVTKAVLHAFDGKASSALPGVECGYFFSVPPSIARSPQAGLLLLRRKLTLHFSKQKLVSAVPLSNLLLETDSPALGPEAMVRNVPANVAISCQWIAKLKNISVDEVRKITTENAVKLFPAVEKLLKT